LKKKRKKKKKRKEEWQERYEWDESSERKIKCKEGCHVVERRNFHSFSNYVQSNNEDVIVPRRFFCLCTCPPFYIFSSLISPHMD
jgi:hypothetical protein